MFCVDVYNVQEEKVIGLHQLAKLTFELATHEDEDFRGKLFEAKDYCKGFWSNYSHGIASDNLKEACEFLLGKPRWYIACFLATLFEYEEYPRNMFYAGAVTVALGEISDAHRRQFREVSDDWWNRNIGRDYNE